MTPTRIVLLSHSPDTPSLALVVDDGRVIDREELLRDPEVPPEPLPCVLIAPGTEALVRWLELPVRTEAQAGPAAAMLLEEQLATPRDRTHLALGASVLEEPRLAVVVDQTVLSEWIERATALGVYPEVILPDHLTLPPPDDEGETLAVRFGDTYAVRGEQLALSCEAELLPLVMGERPWREITDIERIEAMLIAAAAMPAVNLLQQSTSLAAPPSTWRQLRAAAVLLGLLALSPLVLSPVSTLRHDAATAEVERRTEARVRTALPPAERIVNADAQLRTRIETLRSTSDSFPAAAAALFAALQQAGGMDIESLSYEPDQSLRATLSYSTPGDLDLFRAAARQAGFEVQVSGGSSLNGRLRSDVALSRVA